MERFIWAIPSFMLHSQAVHVFRYVLLKSLKAIAFGKNSYQVLYTQTWEVTTKNANNSDIRASSMVLANLYSSALATVDKGMILRFTILSWAVLTSKLKPQNVMLISLIRQQANWNHEKLSASCLINTKYCWENSQSELLRTDLQLLDQITIPFNCPYKWSN